MSESEERERVVRIAREWIRTPYQHGARIKHVAGDCTFVAMVYEEAGLVPHIYISPYSSMAHLHRASGQYLLHVKKYAHEIVRESAKPGDLVMFHIARDFSHSGIIDTDGWPWIIHADMAAQIILRARGDQAQLAAATAMKFYSLNRW